MTPLTLGAGGFIVLLFMMASRIPIGLAMLVVGALGMMLITGPMGILNGLKTLPYEHFSSHTLSIIPLFLLMGQFAARAGLSRAMFQAANDWLGPVAVGWRCPRLAPAALLAPFAALRWPQRRP
nr:TRAP transporter large permease subunit [Halomonas janggokensis]